MNPSLVVGLHLKHCAGQVPSTKALVAAQAAYQNVSFSIVHNGTETANPACAPGKVAGNDLCRSSDTECSTPGGPTGGITGHNQGYTTALTGCVTERASACGGG